jgi:hypothetical protein
MKGQFAADDDIDLDDFYEDDESDGGSVGSQGVTKQVFEVEAIVDVRSRNRMLEYLVKWKGYPSDENTWETEENMTSAKDIVDEYLNTHYNR